MSRSSDDQRPRRVVRSAIDSGWGILLAGFIVIVPFVITLYLLKVAFGIVTDILRPVIDVLQWTGLFRDVHLGFVGPLLVELGVYRDLTAYISEIIAALVLFVVIVALGTIVHFRSGEWLVDLVDEVVTSIPVVGPVFKSFRRMGDVVLESGLENFRDVKLVEFPTDETYSIGFVTNESPTAFVEAIERERGEDELLTMFIPLAPNPVMGGFLSTVSEENVIDVDMTVEEAARALVTSGIAVDGDETGEQPPLDSFRRLRDVELEDIADGQIVSPTRGEDDERGPE